jgi:hypothetical protein
MGRVVGIFLLPVGVFLAIAPFRVEVIGILEAFAILVGVAISVLGFLLSGSGAALWALGRRISVSRLSRRLTALLGSPVELNRELAAIRWDGERNGRRVAISWSLDVPTTQVSIQIEGGSPGTFRIVPNLHRGGRIIGGRTIPTGDVDFDRTYLARSEPASLIGDIFSENRRDTVVDALFGLPDCASCRFILTLNDLRLRIPRVLVRIDEFERLFTVAGAFSSAIREAAKMSGYSVLTVGAGTTGRCPVCVSLLESEVVLCIRCRTPHHQGCWEYTRECATFACGGRRWIPA